MRIRDSFPRLIHRSLMLLVLSLVLVGLASSASAQTITAVQYTVYRQGQTSPAVSPQTIPLSAFQCGQATAPTAPTPPTRNPTGVSFNDPSAPTLWCNWTAPANGIFSMVGYDAAQVYELAVAFVNTAGVGPEARGTFTRPGSAPTATPVGLRIVAGQ